MGSYPRDIESCSSKREVRVNQVRMSWVSGSNELGSSVFLIAIELLSLK